MSETTPTRDEAMLNPLALEALENNQRQLDMDGVEVGVSRQALGELLSAYKAAVARVNRATDAEIGGIPRTFASAPAPASGRVDAVREALLGYVLKPGQYEMASAFARGQNRVAVDMLGVLDEASLSPAATSGSGAGGEAVAAWLTNHPRYGRDLSFTPITEADMAAGYSMQPLYLAKPASSPVVEPPEREGFFWARWHTPAPGTADNGECCNPDEWQVCQVFENCLDEASPGHLMVFVPGVERAQPLDAFEWGWEVRRD